MMNNLSDSAFPRVIYYVSRLAVDQNLEEGFDIHKNVCVNTVRLAIILSIYHTWTSLRSPLTKVIHQRSLKVTHHLRFWHALLRRECVVILHLVGN